MVQVWFSVKESFILLATLNSDLGHHIKVRNGLRNPNIGYRRKYWHVLFDSLRHKIKYGIIGSAFLEPLQIKSLCVTLVRWTYCSQYPASKFHPGVPLHYAKNSTHLLLTWVHTTFIHSIVAYLNLLEDLTVNMAQGSFSNPQTYRFRWFLVVMPHFWV